MRVLADQIASRALTQHSERSTTPTETMDPNPNLVVDAMWHRSALNSNDTGTTFSRINTEPPGQTVSLDEFMLHQNRILHNEDGFVLDDYMTEKSQTLRELLADQEGSTIFS